MCLYCNEPLNKSLYKFDPTTQTLMKSCPSCSVKVGYHTFYPAPDAFGCSLARVNSHNQIGIQSHCKYCRANSEVPAGMIGKSCASMDLVDEFGFQSPLKFVG